MLYLYGITSPTDFKELEVLWGLFSEDPAVYLLGTKKDPEALLTNINSVIEQEAERSQAAGGIKLAGWRMTTRLWPSLVNFSIREGRPVVAQMRHSLDRKYNDSWMFMDVERIYTQGFERDGLPDLGNALSYWLKEELPSEDEVRDKWTKSDEGPLFEEVGVAAADYLRGMQTVVERYYSEPADG